MASGSKGVRKVLGSIANRPSSSAHVCLSCQHNLLRRSYASAATAQATVDVPPISQVTDDGPQISPLSQPRINVKAGVVVSRPPLLTADPHPFETAYHLYQRRLNERLVLPFTQYFYYRRGTPAFDNWKTRRNARGGVAARDLGKYNAYTDEGWNDEVVMGDESGNPHKIVEQLIEEEGRGTEYAGETGNPKMAGLRRTTEADQKNDQKSLERSLSRTLYLLVKSKKVSPDQPENTLWRFPSGSLEEKEGLREAAQRILGLSCGPNMNTWFVGNHPVGHFVQDLKAFREINKIKPKAEDEADEEKTFFMKARIMAGQADLKQATIGLDDYKWLAKEEIEKTVSRGYWSSVKNMLVEQ